MKGALFMSGAVDQSSLADVCRVRYSQCPRVDTWWPGPHLYIGSFCLVGVKLARFESLESRLKNRETQCRYKFLYLSLHLGLGLLWGHGAKPSGTHSIASVI